jgi:hypothetical protein
MARERARPSTHVQTGGGAARRGEVARRRHDVYVEHRLRHRALTATEDDAMSLEAQPPFLERSVPVMIRRGEGAATCTG